MRRLAYFAALVLATLMGAYAVWMFHEAFVLFAASLAVAAAVRPVIERLTQRWHIPRGAALAITYLGGLALLGLVIYEVGGPLLDDVQHLADRLSVLYERVKLSWPHGSALQRTVAARLPPADDIYRALAPGPMALAQQTLATAFGAFGILADVAVVIVLGIYWNASHEAFERLLLSLVPAERRVHAREIWWRVEVGVGAHLRSELGQSLLAMLLLSLGFHFMGLGYTTLPAAVGGLARLIPLFGLFTAVAAALLAGLAQSPRHAAMAALYTFVVLVALSKLLAPRMFRSRRYNPILVVFAVVALTDAYGLKGLIAAPFLAAAVQTCCEGMLGIPLPPQRAPAVTIPEMAAWVSEPAAGDSLPDRVAAVSEQIALLHQRILDRGERIKPELGRVMERLERLVDRTSRTVS